jgi:rod shape determining protein RodA
LLVVPFGLIAKQPDLGTALLVGGAGFFVIFLAGLPWKVIIGLVAAGAAAAPLLWGMMHDYQRKRILTLIDPTTDPLGCGLPHHPVDHRHRLRRPARQGLPQRHPDPPRVHSGKAHRLHLCGLFRRVGAAGQRPAGLPLHPADRARHDDRRRPRRPCSRACWPGPSRSAFFTYAFINMGMVSGILPVVGVPLPFMSYGGTALVTLFLGIGILMSIHTHRMLVKK